MEGGRPAPCAPSCGARRRLSTALWKTLWTTVIHRPVHTLWKRLSTGLSTAPTGYRSDGPDPTSGKIFGWGLCRLCRWCSVFGMDNTPPPPTATPNSLVCEVCEEVGADTYEFTCGPIVLAIKDLCMPCCDDYDPPRPTLWDRWAARP